MELAWYEIFCAGFEVNVDHPHPHVVKCMQFLKGE